MTESVDLAIIGAGPTGLSAAVQAAKLGLRVTLLDDQPAPGGQIWRAIEARAVRTDSPVEAEAEATDLVRRFRESGATYLPGRRVWRIDPGFSIWASNASGDGDHVQARALLLATGAQERPTPFPGWTLPGVMPVGAAQILLKTADQIPDKPVTIAGAGPLSLLYARQLLAAGGRVAAILDTSPSRRMGAITPALLRALRAPGMLRQGLGWRRELRRAGVPIVSGVTELQAVGETALEAVRYRDGSGQIQETAASLLLVHEGVIPSVHAGLAIGCDYFWRADQACFAPRLDEWGESSVAGAFIAGDGAGIGGAQAAAAAGDLAALGVARRLGRLKGTAAEERAAEPRARLKSALAIRPLLDAWYAPRPESFNPADETIVCRCEEVTAGDIRHAAKVGIRGPNQVKTFTRCGMGPCQGRQCGHILSAILAEMTGEPMDDLGFLRVRQPLEPVTLGELAGLDTEDIAVMS